MRRLWQCFILIALLLLPAAVSAQGAPDQINIALDRLSAEVNRTVTINDLSNWLWAQDLYPDLSLGCPQPDTAYAQVAVQGFKFTFTYQGVVYDYRVSADGKVAFLCSSVSEAELAAATPTPVAPETIDTSVICFEPEPGVIYLPSRLTTDMQARVVAGPPVVQRGEPGDESGIVGEIPAGAIVKVEAGPVCASGQLWWQLNYDGQVGWGSEGQGDVYALETVPGRALPFGLPSISTADTAQVAELSQAQNNFGDSLANAPAGTTVAVAGGPGTGGVWLYTPGALDAQPRLLPGPAQPTDLQFAPTGDLILLGDTGGGVRLWSIDPNTTLVERWFDQGHEGRTTAVAMAPDGRTVASAGDVAVTSVPVDRNNAIVLWDVQTVSQKFALGGHTGTVNALAFSPDGTKLVSAGSGGAIVVWDVATRAQAQVLQSTGTVTYALAFSPDGALLASAGGDDATVDYDIRLWDTGSGQEIARLNGHANSIRDLAFSPDGTLLISVSDDHSVRFWGAGPAG